MKKIKVGQVFKLKQTGNVHFVCIAVSRDGMYAVNGISPEFVDPVWEVSYLLKNYILDERFKK